MKSPYVPRAFTFRYLSCLGGTSETKSHLHRRFLMECTSRHCHPRLREPHSQPTPCPNSWRGSCPAFLPAAECLWAGVVGEVSPASLCTYNVGSALSHHPSPPERWRWAPGSRAPELAARHRILTEAGCLHHPATQLLICPFRWVRLAQRE